MDKLSTQVLIIGAGPTGLMAANQLMRFGIDFIILDSKEGPTQESRAIAVTARSMEVYEQMGLSKQVLEEGERINSLNIFLDGKKKVEVVIGEIGKGLTDFNYLLTFEQSRNEAMMARNLEQGGKQIMWNTAFLRLEKYKKEIAVIVEQDGGERTLTAQYLIACDGAGSPVRHQLDFRFRGGTYENRFFVADTVMEWNQAYDKLALAPDKKNFCAFLPMKGEHHYRVLGTLPKEYADKEDITFEDIKNEVIATSKLPVKFNEVYWFSTYKLHHRGVEHFRKGGVFLAGDSAHIHSPAGGQGMNTGMQDAYNLAWKLAFVLKGYASPKLLDTYDEERLPFAKWLLDFTDRLFKLITSSNVFVAFARKYIALPVAGMLVGSRYLRPILFRRVSQIWYSYRGMSLSKSRSRQRLKFKAGDRLPYLEMSDGSSFYSQFTEASFHLLHIGNAPMTDEQQDEAKQLFPFPITIVENRITDQWRKLGVKKELFVLVRPDNYVGSVWDVMDSAKLKKYLEPADFISFTH